MDIVLPLVLNSSDNNVSVYFIVLYLQILTHLAAFISSYFPVFHEVIQCNDLFDFQICKPFR